MKMAKRFLDVSYNRAASAWQVTLIDRETRETVYRAGGTILLEAMVHALQYAEDPDSIDHTDWAKATMGEIQKLLEE